MRSVNSTVFLRFICSFLLFILFLLILEYSLMHFHFFKNINCEQIGIFAAVFASKDAMQKFHTTFRRSPTWAEYSRFVIFSAFFATAVQAILVLFIKRNGRLPPISAHFWLTGLAIVAMMLGLVAFGYSGWNANNGSILGRPK